MHTSSKHLKIISSLRGSGAFKYVFQSRNLVWIIKRKQYSNSFQDYFTSQNCTTPCVDCITQGQNLGFHMSLLALIWLEVLIVPHCSFHFGQDFFCVQRCRGLLVVTQGRSTKCEHSYKMKGSLPFSAVFEHKESEDPEFNILFLIRPKKLRD